MSRGTEAIVIGKTADVARVRVYRSPTCRNCTCILHDACTPEEAKRRRGFLGSLFNSDPVLELDALDQTGANPGDRCLVQLKADLTVVKGSALVYLIPGLFFVLGLALGGLIGRAQWDLTGDSLILAQLLGGLSALSGAFLFARIYGARRAQDEFMPVITQVLVRAADQQRPELLQISPSPSNSR